MNRIRFGFVAGVIFGVLDILPMFAMKFPNPAVAIAAAFASRFAIGFLIPQVRLPLPGWLSGIVVAVLISIPDAIVTGAYGPILATGVAGGAIIGALVGWRERQVGLSRVA